MPQSCRKLGLISLPAIYWLAVTFAPLLHDHAHHAHTHQSAKPDAAVKASHTCSHHHHSGHKHAHSHSHSHPHSHAGHHHHHQPGAPLHDDDCAACRFLALKPAPTTPVAVEVVVELLPQEVPELTPAIERTPLPLPESRGPPAAV